MEEVVFFNVWCENDTSAHWTGRIYRNGIRQTRDKPLFLSFEEATQECERLSFHRRQNKYSVRPITLTDEQKRELHADKYL